MVSMVVPVNITVLSLNLSRTLGNINAESIEPRPNRPNAQVVACSVSLKVD